MAWRSGHRDKCTETLCQRQIVETTDFHDKNKNDAWKGQTELGVG